MIKAEFLLGALEALLNGPAQTGRLGQFGKPHASWCQDQIVGSLACISPIAPDQQPAFETFVHRPRQRDARPVASGLHSA